MGEKMGTHINLPSYYGINATVLPHNLVNIPCKYHSNNVSLFDFYPSQLNVLKGTGALEVFGTIPSYYV
jgi:hypothetical protein